MILNVFVGSNQSTANPKTPPPISGGSSNAPMCDLKDLNHNGMSQHRFTSEPMGSNRITVDIRGASLDADWNVMIKRQDDGTRYSKVENGVRNASTTVSSMAGALVSVLMIAKLVEEILFIRNLRRELSSITSAFSDGSSGVESQGRTSKASRTTGGGSNGLAFDLMSLGMSAVGGAKGNETDSSITWDKVAGLHEVKMLLQEVTVLPSLRPDLFTGIRQPPRGILLFGPPGSGKTLLARAVAAESRSSFIPVTGSSILSMWFGQSEQNVKQLFEKARRQQPCVIFIDEVDSLLGRRSGGGGGGGGGDSMPDKRVTNEFLSFIDGIQSGGADSDCRITIMAATNNPWDLDEAALSRFSRRIMVPLPDKTTRAQLVQKALRGVSCDICQEQFTKLADKMAQYSGRDLVAICREAAMQPVRELWGNCLLAGAGEESRVRAAEQRLLQVVVSQLKKGMPHRRIRKELEAYKKRQLKEQEREESEKDSATASPLAAAAAVFPAPGSVAVASTGVRPEGSSPSGNSLAWLDVDKIMRQAEEAFEGGKKRAGGSLRTPPPTPTQPVENQELKEKESMKESLKENMKEVSDSHRITCGTDDEVSFSDLATITDSVDRDVSKAGQAAEKEADDTEALVGVELGLKDAPGVSMGDDECVNQPAAATSDRSYGHGTKEQVVRDQQRMPESAGGTSTATESLSGIVSDPQDGVVSSSTLLPSRDRARKDAGSDRLSKRAEAGPEMSVESLMAMPSDKLRPVSVKDFDKALAVIMPTDFEGLTSRYEEWNARYGSGTDSKREGGRGGRAAYSTMYI
ncbi:hypothetical protein CEUSTIGMA_g6379.t1 [Chlamydomonas eustigma]|uniref:AAA+ ATPase domain-containing protein n=1 Tax=Chlamydomonas eustigma TaxID=1157962 RepID=A0A250X7P4_9CHLO|nr:hypothetical protein CEUSTIGMA_g6379.t1 [Chlamydomonas eustigma]|eukprot:GAX78939.1 hypothetical protein CEUSTIGMA_g6379.t1 [Chlamydomonas eustigma]